MLVFSSRRIVYHADEKKHESFCFVKGTTTVIGKLAEEPQSLKSVIREVSKK